MARSNLQAVKPRVFWDSSGIITAIYSKKPDSAARQLLQLGDLGFIDMCYCRDVVRDVQYLVQKSRAELLPELALALNRADFNGESAQLSPATVSFCMAMTGYRPDARVLACAIECDADIFVTTDKQHFLGNPLIGPRRPAAG